MVKISVVIITHNEEKNIGRCIDSALLVADEIVVVDSFSRDRTRAICEERAVRFLENPFKPTSIKRTMLWTRPPLSMFFPWTPMNIYQMSSLTQFLK